MKHNNSDSQLAAVLNKHDVSGWISMDDAVPPYNKSVIIIDKNGVVSFGKIFKISTGYEANGMEPIVFYEWKSVEPYVYNPTHWMPLPSCR